MQARAAAPYKFEAYVGSVAGGRHVIDRHANDRTGVALCGRGRHGRDHRDREAHRHPHGHDTADDAGAPRHLHGHSLSTRKRRAIEPGRHLRNGELEVTARRALPPAADVPHGDYTLRAGRLRGVGERIHAGDPNPMSATDAKIP